MTRQEIKEQAKLELGQKLFERTWMMGVLVCLVYSAVVYFVNMIIPGAASLILLGPMSYGLCYVFLKFHRDHVEMNVGDLFKGFTSDFGQNLLLGLLMAIFTALWSILLVVPGIVKFYSWSMAFYVKVDHPDYNWRQCMDASKALMDGHKMDLFVQDLSFIGWFIVGSAVFGVGTLWVMPYFFLARTIFYENIAIPQITDGTTVNGETWYQE